MSAWEQPPSSPPLHQEQLSLPKAKFSIWKTFKRQIPYLILTVVSDVILPLIIYYVLQLYIPTVYALMVAGSPALVMVIGKAIWSCAFDALGFLVFIGFAVSVVLSVVTGSAFLLLLEKSLITAVLSIVFAVTLIPCKCYEPRCRFRPIVYYLYQDLIPTGRAQIGLPDSVFGIKEKDDDADLHMQVKDKNMSRKSYKKEVTQVYEWLYTNCPSFRLSCRLITVIWSVGFLAEFLVRIGLILADLSVNSIVLYSNIILSLIAVICVLLTVVCVVKERKHTLAYIEQWKRDHIIVELEQTQTPVFYFV